MRRVLSCLLVLCLPGPWPTAAAADTGTLEGVIVDDAGATLPGATVTATGSGTGVVRTAVTGRDGFYHLAGLPPGRYGVKASLAGFDTAETGVTVSGGQVTRQDLQLRVASMAETVTVVAAPSRVKVGRRAAPMGQGITGIAPALPPDWNTEKYARIDESRFVSPRQHPLSTFSVDVDTASYANVRRFLVEEQLPPPDSVRIEELLNYFRYDYPASEEPVSVHTEVGPCPWNGEHRLVLVAVRGRTPAPRVLPPARNLVFLVDVSGSMNSPDKLPLLTASLERLIDQLGARDRLAVVVYAGAAGLVLPSTPGDQHAQMKAALGLLEAGGSTNGGAGIQLAYKVARENFLPEGVNRVVLATDGDFNVGVTSDGDLTRLIEKERESGVFLSVLGFGRGNLGDSTMEALADRGNGNYAYVDSLREAEKVLVREGDATIVTVARDVKIQVELNPARVSGYRLIGYENRRLQDEDFRDDRKDAGEIGAGGSVTALYEIVPVGAPAPVGRVDPLKYQAPAATAAGAAAGELMTVKVRFKPPSGGASAAIETAVADAPSPDGAPNLRFAAAVAEFGLLLRGSKFKAEATYSHALDEARAARGADPYGDRAEFETLIARAARLAERRSAAAR